MNEDLNFKTHLFIELFLRSHNGLLLEQAINEDRGLLFEEYGVFKGCEKIARKMVEIIKENIHSVSHSFNVKIKNCDFIDSLEVSFHNRLGAGFIPYMSQINNEGKYDPLSLKSGLQLLDNDEEMLVCLMHELTHAYQNLNLSQKGKTLYGELTKKKYFENNINPKTSLSWVLYYLNQYEVGAYVASIAGDLKACNKMFTSIDEVYDFIKNRFWKVRKTVETLAKFSEIYLDHFQKV